MTDDAAPVLIFLSIIAVFSIIWAIFENLPETEEGTLEERKNDPLIILAKILIFFSPWLPFRHITYCILHPWSKALAIAPIKQAASIASYRGSLVPNYSVASLSMHNNYSAIGTKWLNHIF